MLQPFNSIFDCRKAIVYTIVENNKLWHIETDKIFQLQEYSVSLLNTLFDHVDIRSNDQFWWYDHILLREPK